MNRETRAQDGAEGRTQEDLLQRELQAQMNESWRERTLHCRGGNGFVLQEVSMHITMQAEN